MTAEEQVQAMIEYLGVNRFQFARNLGINPQTLQDLKSGRIRTLSSKILAEIVNHYPQFNPAWLVTGCGNMLVGGSSNLNINTNVGDSISSGDECTNSMSNGDDATLVQSLRLQIKSLSEKVEELKQDKEHLKKIIDTLILNNQNK